MHHYKLFRSLLSIGVPIIVVDVLCNWYSKMFYVVKWNGSLSRVFTIGSGVRQGTRRQSHRRSGLANLPSVGALPYNLYCVGGDVKHCTIQSKVIGHMATDFSTSLSPDSLKCSVVFQFQCDS